MDESEGITFQNIGGVFIVISVGIIMACISLIYEYYIKKNEKTSEIMYMAEVRRIRLSLRPCDSPGRRFGKASTQKSRKLRRRTSTMPDHFNSKY